MRIRVTLFVLSAALLAVGAWWLARPNQTGIATAEHEDTTHRLKDPDPPEQHLHEAGKSERSESKSDISSNETLRALRDVQMMEESFEKFAALVSITRRADYINLETSDLYDLLDELVLIYKGDADIDHGIREVRIELARRGEREPLETIVQAAQSKNAWEANRAIEELARVGTTAAIDQIVSILDDDREGAQSADEFHAAPSDAAAIVLRYKFPDSHWLRGKWTRKPSDSFKCGGSRRRTDSLAADTEPFR